MRPLLVTSLLVTLLAWPAHGDDRDAAARAEAAATRAESAANRAEAGAKRTEEAIERLERAMAAAERPAPRHTHRSARARQ